MFKLEVINFYINFVNRNRLHVLISDEQYNPPICELNPNRSLLSTLHSFMTVSILEEYYILQNIILVNSNIKYINNNKFKYIYIYMLHVFYNSKFL